MPAKWFLDTAYAIALSAPGDLFHEQALDLANKIEEQRVELLTTRAVLLEIGNALSKLRYRRESVRLLYALETDPNILIISLSDELYRKALMLYRERPDKEWGLTDCLSFIVMDEYSVQYALTTDEHFQQAGFHILLNSRS